MAVEAIWFEKSAKSLRSQLFSSHSHNVAAYRCCGTHKTHAEDDERGLVSSMYTEVVTAKLGDLLLLQVEKFLIWLPQKLSIWCIAPLLFYIRLTSSGLYRRRRKGHHPNIKRAFKTLFPELCTVISVIMQCPNFYRKYATPIFDSSFLLILS